MSFGGGVGPTISPEDHIKLTDIICTGEGERALEELVVAVRDGKIIKISKIFGLMMDQK